MIKKKVTVKDLMNQLSYECITGDENALNREIKVPDVNRPGLELTGYYLHSQRERVVLLGNKEMGFISGMSNEVQYSSFDFLTQKETPCIIITRGSACPTRLKEIAQRKNFPVLLCKDNTSRAMVEVVTYLDIELAPIKTMHGVFLQIYGKGVLLTGESGRRFQKLTRRLKELKIAIIRSLPEIIRKAHLSQDNVMNFHGDSSRYAYFVLETELNGLDVRIRIDVRKTSAKNKFWLHMIDINEKNPITQS